MASRTLVHFLKYLVFFVLFQNCSTEEEIGSPLRVAQCRARCLQRFTNGSTLKSCPLAGECSACWSNCQLLQSNFAVLGSLCDKKNICFSGCKEACQFQTESSGVQQRAPVIQTRGEEVIAITESSASWPEPSRATGPLVYVVMRRLPGGGWRQVTQTVERSVLLSPPSTTAVRVLVVNRDGLVTIYSPLSTSLAGARSVLSTLGKNPLGRLGYPIPDLPPLPQPQGKRINTEILPSTSRPHYLLEDLEAKNSWTLREISLIHQKVLVIAEISWEARATGQRPVYFVTWEVDGGVLKGNLFTDSTSVTLSLWPDTVYRIQVELLRYNSMSEKSEELVVDTHRAVAVEVPGDRGEMPGPHRVPAIGLESGFPVELALGFSAALALFLLLLALALFYSARSRSRQMLNEKLLAPNQSEDEAVAQSLRSAVSTVSNPTSLQPHRSRTLHV